MSVRNSAKEGFFFSIAALGDEADGTLSHLDSRGNQNRKVADAFADSRREQRRSQGTDGRQDGREKCPVWVCVCVLVRVLVSVLLLLVTEFQHNHIDNLQDPDDTVSIFYIFFTDNFQKSLFLTKSLRQCFEGDKGKGSSETIE